MTDLQISLIAIGATIVVGVVGYNKWQEIRARKHVERAFSVERDDILMKQLPAGVAAERQEPVFAEQDFTSGAAGTAIDTEPPLLAEAAPYEAGTDVQVEELPVDPMIDCVIPLSLDVAVRGEKVLPLLQTLRHVGSKPVHFMGLVESGEGQQWQPIVHGGVYSQLQAGVQMSTRASALNELEYSELIVRLRQIADELDAEPDIPDMSKVMVSARALHQFVAQHDARLGINVRANGAPWAISTLLTALERQGFDVRPDGRFIMQDDKGGALFSLTTNETVAAEYTSCLTLLLDVPRVAPEREGFTSMVASARSLVKRLDGTMVDDGNQPLSDAAIDEIALQVRAFYEDMQAAGIPAGSYRAQRLFI